MIEEQILYEKWLKGLQVGDRVIFVYDNKDYYSTVLEVSDNIITCLDLLDHDGDILFYRKNGFWTWGGSCYLKRITKKVENIALLTEKSSKLIKLLSSSIRPLPLGGGQYGNILTKGL